MFISRPIFWSLFVVMLFAQSNYTNAQESDIVVDEVAVSEVVEEQKNDEAAQGLVTEDQALLPVDTLTGDPLIEDMVRRTFVYELNINPIQIPSLFFTVFEQNLLADARKGLVARPATESEVAEAERQIEEDIPPPMGPREISLGGIVYVSSGDWTIWLNGQKITPDRIPPEILDIRVSKDYIKLKWFDAFTNQIYPVKMRTHQRFNIDTRIFLPG